MLSTRGLAEYFGVAPQARQDLCTTESGLVVHAAQDRSCVRRRSLAIPVQLLIMATCALQPPVYWLSSWR